LNVMEPDCDCHNPRNKGGGIQALVFRLYKLAEPKKHETVLIQRNKLLIRALKQAHINLHPQNFRDKLMIQLKRQKLDINCFVLRFVKPALLDCLAFDEDEEFTKQANPRVDYVEVFFA